MQRSAEFAREAGRSLIASGPFVRIAATLAACALTVIAVYRERTAEFAPRRVWGELSPVFETLGQCGWRLTSVVLDWPDLVLASGGLVTALLVIAWLVFDWHRGWVASLWLLAALSAGVGQWAFLRGKVSVGVGAYACALCLAVAFGWLVQSRQALGPRAVTNKDYAAGLWVLIIALFLRLWALDELPSRFEGEMGLSMLAGSSWQSLKNYLVDALTTASIGCAHLFVQLASFLALGDSVFALRASAVLMGAAVVWNLFWLLRRYVGPQGAWCAALLAISSAEQLWWSRSENSYFIAVCLAGVITARLSAWLLASPSWRKAIIVAVWMGLTRLFYLAAVTLVAIPSLVLLHRMVFDRTHVRQYAGAFFVVLLGVGLWASSLSLVHLVSKGEWRWIHPAVHGELADAESTPLLQRVAAVGERVVQNARQVARQWTIETGFSQWYQRQTWPYPPTILHVGIVALGVLGVGIALAQWRYPFPAMLLMWFFLACLPALLSIEPAERRMAAAFPAFYALAGYGWGHAVNWICSSSSTFLKASWHLAGWIVLVMIGWSSASSHLTLPRAEVGLATLGRATKHVFRASEAVYYEMDEAAFPLLVMVHSSLFRQRLPCTEALAPASWLTTLLEQPCSFNDVVWRLMSPTLRAQRQAQYVPPSQWSVLLAAVPDAERKRQLLRHLFPNGREHWIGTPDWNFSLTVFTVTRSDLEALQRFEVVEEPPLAGPGVEEKEAGCTMTLRGALFVPRDGWYRWRLAAPFEPLAWTIGNESGTFEVHSNVPLTAGFHLAQWKVRGPCGERPALFLKEHGESEWRSVPLWNTELGRDELTRATRVVAHEGYTSHGRFGEQSGEFLDLGIADTSGMVALVWRDGRYEFLELDAAGQPLASYRVDIPGHTVVNGFVPGPQGRRFVHTESGMWVTDREGRMLRRWPVGPGPIRAQIVWWDDGNTLLAAVPAAAEVQWFDLAGRLLGATSTFDGGPRRFLEPTALAYDPSRRIFAVAEADGRILLLRIRGSNPLDLAFERELRPPLSVRRMAVRVLTFDGQGRLLVGDPERPAVFAYDSAGQRLMAQQPENDWMSQVPALGVVRRIVPLEGQLLVLAGGHGAVRFQEGRFAQGFD
ncbi:hypothetical protein HRbin30_00385 [bacterium HR30]|nr:hypothetical protein HRbin30_00385 [bacterium HR30]